jgi:DtxR family transcriptional regulator, Mn-dependent transcriptional regulator
MTEDILSASLEDYLEAIFHIVRKKQAARPKDISQFLEVGNSSVTGALKALAARNLVNYAPYDLVTLTPSGEEAARDVVRRHESLREFFIKVLAADNKLADEAACKMEHAIPAELMDRFVRFVEFVEMCPQGGSGLLEGFRDHLEKGCRPTRFDDCSFISSLPTAHAGSGTTGEITTLADLEPDQHAVITRVQGKGSLRRRLMDLGLIAGTPVTMERSAPLGDPLKILVKGTHLSLCREEATSVQVEIEA